MLILKCPMKFLFSYTSIMMAGLDGQPVIHPCYTLLQCISAAARQMIMNFTIDTNGPQWIMPNGFGDQLTLYLAPALDHNFNFYTRNLMDRLP